MTIVWVDSTWNSLFVNEHYVCSMVVKSSWVDVNNAGGEALVWAVIFRPADLIFNRTNITLVATNLEQAKRIVTEELLPVWVLEGRVNI